MGSLDANLPLPSIHGFKPLDLDDLREQVHQTVDFIMDYYKNVESFPVLPSVQPGYLRGLLPATPSDEPTTFDAILRDLRRAILPGLTHWTSPNFFAYFPATLSSAALAGDLLASAFNPVAFNWLSSPAATELESLVLDWLAHLLRLRGRPRRRSTPHHHQRGHALHPGRRPRSRPLPLRRRRGRHLPPRRLRLRPDPLHVLQSMQDRRVRSGPRQVRPDPVRV
ncbi:putative tryptophan decarboxylase 1-like [Cocos nucifera]|uniref:Putative tryptophan decarboxylase 1-like n=1 Tax=Cocos nucifera TaxID=13894 RepID=A0A8K0NAD0_COCNU|nr:putative tryptophan decarboxylase 1-like [Cocos nucifera]